MIYEEPLFFNKRLGCFIFPLLARPFSRPSDLKSRSCSSEGFISAGAVCAASSYLASSIIGGGFGRRLFRRRRHRRRRRFDLGARGALFGRRVLGLRGVACAPPSRRRPTGRDQNEKLLQKHAQRSVGRRTLRPRRLFPFFSLSPLSIGRLVFLMF